MRDITPYTSVTEALAALDNGGHFFNLFTTARDGKIADSELCRAAGVIAGLDQAFLFFELALARLTDSRRRQVTARLSPDLRRKHERHAPLRIGVEAFARKAEKDRTAILAGYPRFIEDRSEFKMFIMMPISTGKTTTFMPMPIFDQFDVYELHASADRTGAKCIVATAQRKERLKPELTVFGGAIREMTFSEDAYRTDAFYLEASYRIAPAT